LLAEANTGDMVVVSNKDRTNSCIIIVQRQQPDLSPPQMSATFPIGKCVEMDRGAVWYNTVVDIAGDEGSLIVVPKKNVQPALNAMLGMVVNFQH
jgi:hypothetical protein